ncbi:EEF1A lysine methyltransferase 3-like [Synchiropus splendidus]|uniref:EEF1A lysine methyltransferase 3-like n=1 Tax=Synchiropus splendidus TaxID=270530 RepID=UPI00237E1406|nr:EEF1A lysine methyltransferase 3-like [Synchiropus splendidus]
MLLDEDGDDPFPAGADVFDETFCEDQVYTLLGQELKIRQMFGAQLGVAAPVWDAALHLCRFMEKHGVELRGKRVVELGAGTGVVGIAASLIGAHVTLTDLPLALTQLQANVNLNAPPGGWLSVPPAVLPLSWGQDHTRFSSDWDLVLGTDIVYLPETFPLLLETLAHLCKRGATVYLSSKMRAEHKTSEFFEDYLSRRFHVELVEHDEEQNIHIFRAHLTKDRSPPLNVDAFTEQQ